jgi:hypothetical protein
MYLRLVTTRNRHGLHPRPGRAEPPGSDAGPGESARRLMVGRRSDRTGTQAAEAASPGPGGAGELSSPGGHWQSDGRCSAGRESSRRYIRKAPSRRAHHVVLMSRSR